MIDDEIMDYGVIIHWWITPYGGFHKWGDHNSWMVQEGKSMKIQWTWMMTRGTVPPPILGNLDINPLLFFGARCDRNWGVESVEYRLNIAWIPMIHHVMLNGSPMVDQQSMITTSRGFKPRFPSAKWVMSDHIQSRVAPSWLISACRLQLYPSHTHPC